MFYRWFPLKKTSFTRKLIFGISFGFFIVSGLISANGVRADADAVLQENFESCDYGLLNNQKCNQDNSWTGENYFWVQPYTVFEGDKAISTATGGPSYRIICNTASSSENGNQTIRLRINRRTDGDIRLELFDTLGRQIFITGLFFDYANGILYYSGTQSEYVKFADYEADVWYEISIQWRVSDHKARYRVGLEDWTDWDTGLADDWVALNSVCLTTHHFMEELTTGYYDYITKAPTISGWFPVIFPTLPQDCAFSSTTNFQAVATGQIQIPNLNPDIWNYFEIRFSDINTDILTLATTTLPDLYAGQTYNYSIPFSLATSTYWVSYYLEGQKGGAYFPIQISQQFWYCKDTFYGLSTTQKLPTIIEPIYPEIEDCSTYPLLERLVCELKTTFQKIFWPSVEEINLTKSLLATTNDKFPINYFIATKNFFDDIRAQTSTSSIPFTLFGVGGGSDSNVSFSAFLGDITFAGKTMSVLEWIRNFFLIFLLLLFFGYLLIIPKRIFK